MKDLWIASLEPTAEDWERYEKRMNIDKLEQHVWDNLSVRKHLAGRARISRIVRRAVREWPSPVLAQCDAKQADVVGHYMGRSLERNERQYGMGFFLAIVLSAVIGEIVKVLIRWWLERQENREAMLEMQR